MGLKQKIHALLDPEKRLSAQLRSQRQQAAEQRGFPLTATSMLECLDQEKLNAIIATIGSLNPGEHTVKYLDFEKWFTANIRRVLNIGLDFQRPKRILDLGSGAGYFLHTCKRLGHDVLGLDVNDPTATWYTRMFELYGIRRVITYIHRFKPLPDLGGRFDYVTAFMVCFNQHQSGNPWGIKEWGFFLDDLWQRLNPGAVVWFELNPALDGTHYSPELGRYFQQRGAIVDGKRIIWGISPLQYKVLLRLAELEAVAMRKAAARQKLQPVG